MRIDSMFKGVWLAGVYCVALSVCASSRESALLPESFSVYVQNNVVINHPQEGFEKRILPTRNLFRGSPGGYIACYSHNHSNSIYGVGGGIYVMGQMRLQGHYYGSVFQPQGHEGKDISRESVFKTMCNTTFYSCRGGCWAGGDTGGWF